MDATPEPLTHLLQQADRGDREAANQLYLLVQDQLRAIAKKRKAHLDSGVDFSTTMLVNDAFCQLVGRDATLWPSDSRKKFFAYVATKMHSLIVDAARHHAAQKRGGEFQRAPQDIGEIDLGRAEIGENAELMIDLQEALTRFEQFALEDAIVFRVRYFLGSTFDEIAEILSLSATSVKRAYERACAWLQRDLKSYDPA